MDDGFEIANYWYHDRESGLTEALELYLPVSIAPLVMKTSHEAAKLSKALHVSECAARAVEVDLLGHPQLRDKVLPREADPEEKLAGMKARDLALSKDDYVQIFQYSSIENLRERLDIGDRENRSTFKHWYKKLFDNSNGSAYRKVRRYPIEYVDLTMSMLADEFPHFLEVVQHVKRCLYLASQQSAPGRISPILLNGPPGVGKTQFCKRLASLLEVTLTTVSFDTSISNARLLGSDRTWANTCPGVILEALAGPDANPLVLLDEIDKCRKSGDHQSPIESLHSLLEPVTASSVEDISLSMSFDAGWITYVATTNNPSAIPASLRSRFTEFSVSDPVGSDALQFAKQLLEATYVRLQISNLRQPDLKLSKYAAHLDARTQIKVYEAAFGRAVLNGRNQLTEFDLLEAVGDEGDQPARHSTLH